MNGTKRMLGFLDYAEWLEYSLFNVASQGRPEECSKVERVVEYPELWWIAEVRRAQAALLQS